MTPFEARNGNFYRLHNHVDRRRSRAASEHEAGALAGVRLRRRSGPGEKKNFTLKKNFEGPKVSHSTLAQQGRGLARTGTHTGTPPEPPKRKDFSPRPSGLSHSTLCERGGVRTVPLCSCVAHLSWRCLLYLFWGS